MSGDAYECDHMRFVVLDEDGEWRHIGPDGHIASPCRAGIYKVAADTQLHDVTRLVFRKSDLIQPQAKAEGQSSEGQS